MIVNKVVVILFMLLTTLTNMPRKRKQQPKPCGRPKKKSFCKLLQAIERRHCHYKHEKKKFTYIRTTTLVTASTCHPKS